jgi:PleD family two-component response regulator
LSGKLKNLDYLFDSASILIIEDLTPCIEQIISDLRQIKIKGPIHEARSVKAAMQIINNKEIDLIICDWKLPESSGYNFLTSIRKLPQHANTPFIMWTTKNEVTNIIEAISAGANEYFCKPWTKEELELKLKQAWGKVHGLT